MLHGLDLFSGIGGITEALVPWVVPVAYCENDRYAQAVLRSRMERRELPAAPIWDDVRTLRGHMLPGIDIVYGGFPCQDISIAGAGAGLEGERSGLFFEVARLVREIRPHFVFLENVPAITFRGLGDVAEALAALRYDCRWGMLSAYDMGAPHLRERWWLLAYTDCDRRDEFDTSKQELQPGREGEADPPHNGGKEPLADSDGKRQQQPCGDYEQGGERISDGSEDVAGADLGAYDIEGSAMRAHSNGEGFAPTGADGGAEENAGAESYHGWPAEPDVGRVVNGLPFRSDRIRALGNSVVPLCAREAFKRLSGLDKEDQ